MIDNIVIESCKEFLSINFPQLIINSMCYLSEGWDSIVFIVNNNLIFRFPKTNYVQRRMRIEIGLLPELRSRVSLPIPDFIYTADIPTTKFPSSCVGYEVLIGTPLTGCSNEIWLEQSWKKQLGRFLTELHSFSLKRAIQLGVREKNMTGLEEPIGTWRESLEAFFEATRVLVFPILTQHQRTLVIRHFTNFLQNDNYFNFKPTLIHADFIDRHILLDLQSRTVTGVIDFGDCAIGDPAFDVWKELLPYYEGDIDETWTVRREFYTTLKSFRRIIYGSERHNPYLANSGFHLLKILLNLLDNNLISSNN